MHKIAPYIDHTILKPDTNSEQIRQLCQEALTYGFAAVCVPPYFVSLANDILAESNVKIATVIGFPFGYSTIAAKVEEAKRAIEDGAVELDVVVNIAAIKDARWNYVQNELDILTTTCHLQDKKIKIIFETGLMNEAEIIKLCQISTAIGADFVKTSTGFSSTGASVEVVQLMKNNIPNTIKIKASGGIRTISDAEAMIVAGADRIGTSSGVAMIQ